jgi:hypothetical protein
MMNVLWVQVALVERPGTRSSNDTPCASLVASVKYHTTMLPYCLFLAVQRCLDDEQLQTQTNVATTEMRVIIAPFLRKHANNNIVTIHSSNSNRAQNVIPKYNPSIPPVTNVVLLTRVFNT